MVGAWDADLASVRLGPSVFPYGANDSNKGKTFGATISHSICTGLLTSPCWSRMSGRRGVRIEHVAKTFRYQISGPLLVNTSFDKAEGNQVTADGRRKRSPSVSAISPIPTLWSASALVGHSTSGSSNLLWCRTERLHRLPYSGDGVLRV